MTPTTIALLSQRAHRQLDADFCFCHVTAEQVAGLADGYRDALERLARIAVLADRTRIALADHDLDGVRGKLDEIELLARLDKLSQV
jgi:hypothetical protein